MATTHLVGYSKSVRARCHGPPPCKNSAILVGALRYGKAVASATGEQVEWRHWGCVTPDILNELALVTVHNIVDFNRLKPSDQQKISMAISLRRIDPSDIPETARSGQATSGPPPGPTQLSQKRKAGAPPTIPATSVTAQIPRDLLPGRRRGEEEEENLPMEEEVRDELYCVMVTNVVGIQYYKGLVGPGEQVMLVREPHNKYDANAIQVKNIRNVQVGHLPRTVASKLAPLLDRRAVNVEGVINDGNLGGRTGYVLSITLKFYAPADKRDELEPQLVWATPGQRGFPARTSASNARAARGGTANAQGRPAAGYPSVSQGYASSQGYGYAGASSQQRGPTPTQLKQQEALRKAAELRQMLDSLEKIDDEGRRNSLLDTVCSKDDILNIPHHPNPPGTASGELKVDLLKHQSQALQWCIDRENPKLPTKESDPPVQFWQFRKGNNNTPYYLNIATKTPQREPPQLGKGALCADAMGLGKTLTMIALILATKKENHPNFARSTLIVAPLSILSNWEKQIADHCVPGALTSYIYYGNNRNISTDDLKKYDVVITTYQTITGEHAESAPTSGTKRKKVGERALFEISWKRIILDEGHVIRNPKTKMARAVVGLTADRRWVLSGTPIINSPRDLGSMLTFLRICQPLDNEDFFKRLLIRPLKNGDPEGAELLKALMSHVCIRRTKEMQDANGVPLIGLPPVEMIRVPVTLDPDARRIYDQIEEISQQRIEKMMSSFAPAFVQSNVLSMLTRLRQIALHPGLVPGQYLEQLRAAEAAEGMVSEPARAITPEEKLRLQNLLAQAIEDCEECPICFGVVEDGRITSCAHIFCVACIVETINRDARCPMDRRTLTMGDLFEPPPPTELTQRPIRDTDEKEGFQVGSSAKIDQLVQLLRLAPQGDKSLVFSQFTSFLDKVGETLEAEGIPYVRFDGQMSAKRRQEAIARFSVPVTASSKDTNPAAEQAPPEADNGRPRRTTRRKSAPTSFAVDAAFGDSDDDYNPMSQSSDVDDFDDNDMGDVEPEPLLDTGRDESNPRVMLISLKAVYSLFTPHLTSTF
ncbi:DNA repair protein RAD5, variant 2 [Coprinopsis cinerea AmutBmut pab1-1]|nr:DNA repair protein RAD5, variant 2 [Coprinopsis cinerea AmutBmut pab1-1]